MQPNRLLLALPVIAVLVAASGCTIPGLGGGGTAGLGNGVVITEFTSDFPSIQSGEYVELMLKAQNKGEVKAYNVRAELTGIDITQWGGLLSTSFTTGEFGEMLPYDRETNTPGTERTKQWRLTAPPLPRGTNPMFTAIAKLSYDYKTSALRKIWIVDADELRRILQSGGSLPVGASTVSSGPLTVEVTTGNYEKTAAQQFGYDNLFPVQIKITNTGGGYVVPPGTGTGLYGGSFATTYFGDIVNYPVGVKVTPPAGTSFRSLGGGFGGADDCSTGIVTKEMWKGREATITCELSVDTLPTYREERPLIVDVFYRYQAEASTPIQVFGKETGYGGISGYYW
ncbi:MAG: hypothetical protein FJY76_01715 [Candidatus Aenigmarchaeota archaeon]|nr:hypothetical protein [Candidatus Aenigmarchaeota archaeon]